MGGILSAMVPLYESGQQVDVIDAVDRAVEVLERGVAL
jgi:hypothetical protein